MRLIFLGTGGDGSPPIGVDREALGIVDRSSNALVVQPNYPDGPTLLIDAGPDIRAQWAAWEDAPLQPDAVILTHEHQDHMLGIGQFRHCQVPVPVYATTRTLDHLTRFAEVMFPADSTMNLAPRELPERGGATVAGVEIETVQLHHIVPVTGVIVRHEGTVFAHLSDTAVQVDEEVRAAIRGCDVLAVNMAFLYDTPAPEDAKLLGQAYTAHISVPGAIRLAEEVGAKLLVLLHFWHMVPERVLREVVAMYPWVMIPDDGQVLHV